MRKYGLMSIANRLAAETGKTVDTAAVEEENFDDWQTLTPETVSGLCNKKEYPAVYLGEEELSLCNGKSRLRAALGVQTDLFAAASTSDPLEDAAGCIRIWYCLARQIFHMPLNTLGRFESQYAQERD